MQGLGRTHVPRSSREGRSGIRDRGSGIGDLESGIGESGIRDQRIRESGTWDLGFGIRDLGPGIRDLGSGI